MERKPTFGELLFPALAKGIANLTIERQKQADEKQQGMLQAYQIQQQQEAARMRMEQMRQQMLMTDLEMQKLRRESTLTWEQRQEIEHQNRMEEQRQQQEAAATRAKAEYDRAVAMGLIPSGYKQPTTATGPTKLPTGILTFYRGLINTNLAGQQKDLANQQEYDKKKQMFATAPNLVGPAPVPVPKFDVKSEMRRALLATGGDTMSFPELFVNPGQSGPMGLSMLSAHTPSDLTMPQGNPLQQTPADQMGMGDEAYGAANFEDWDQLTPDEKQQVLALERQAGRLR